MSPAESRVRLEESWQRLVGDQFDEPYMRELSEFLRAKPGPTMPRKPIAGSSTGMILRMRLISSAGTTIAPIAV
jgi:hypothetical protein